MAGYELPQTVRSLGCLSVLFVVPVRWTMHVAFPCDFTLCFLALGILQLLAWGWGRYGNLGNGDVVDW